MVLWFVNVFFISVIAIISELNKKQDFFIGLNSAVSIMDFYLLKQKTTILIFEAFFVSRFKQNP